jgi:uncharacterized protein (TIGR02453 family)
VGEARGRVRADAAGQEEDSEEEDEGCAQMTFAGFPDTTFKFLRGITKDNSKAYFDAHRDDYDSGYVEPAKMFVAAVGPKLQKISKTISYEPRVNGSLFRINRDIRFAKDKSPYKNHLDLWFWEGDRRGWDSPGFFFRMHADRLILGAGMHQFDKQALEAFRAAVLHKTKGPLLEKAIAEAMRAGASVGGATRKTVPRGFDKEHPRAALLLHEGLFATIEGKVPREARSSAFVDWCVERFRACAPIAKWITASLSSR